MLRLIERSPPSGQGPTGTMIYAPCGDWTLTRLVKVVSKISTIPGLVLHSISKSRDESGHLYPRWTYPGWSFPSIDVVDVIDSVGAMKGQRLTVRAQDLFLADQPNTELMKQSRGGDD